MSLKLFAVLLLSLSLHCAGQKDSSLYIDIKEVQYNPVTENYFKGHEKAKLLVDYYHTSGYSHGDRYAYEIIVVDSLVMFGFTAPASDAFNYVSYQKKQLLTTAQLDTLKQVLATAKLKQTKKGIPEPDASAHTKEVLIVKYKGINITGGLFHHEIFSEEDAAIMDREIAAQRRLTSSIGGEYDKVMELLRKYFSDLDALLSQTQKNY